MRRSLSTFLSSLTRTCGSLLASGPASALPAYSHLSTLEGKKRPIGIAAIAFFLLVAFGLLGLEAWSRYTAYLAQYNASQVAVINIVSATAEHAEKSIELVRTILYGVVERVERDGTTGPAFTRLHEVLMARVEQTPGLQGLFVYDEEGRWAVTSLEKVDPKANNADRAYFIYHRNHRDRGPHIGVPIQSRSSGVWILPVSLRLEHADGSFAGVALATVRIDHFQNYYDRFDIGSKGAIMLALADGTMVTRRPYLATATGTSIKSGVVFAMLNKYGDRGTAMRTSMLDKVERLYSYRRVESYPLVIAAGLSKEEIFAPWWENTFREAAALVALLVILLVVAARLHRQIRIRDHMEHELRAARLALQNSVGELEQLANTDGLTGLKNRRFLNEQMELECARAARNGASLALIMIDIDFFKRYNDTYGHVAGDACLKMVSHIIGGVAHRAGDLAARFGGEEFVVLLPNTDIYGALSVANKICAAVSAINEPHSASANGVVTISAGVFAMVPQGVGDVGKLLEAADSGLYAAKAGGRNRVAMGGRNEQGTLLALVPKKILVAS